MSKANKKLAQKFGAADIAAQLRREISTGTLMQHDRLPPERSLAERFDAARGTVRKALLQLEREGYVEIRPGSGTYVVHQAEPSSTDAITGATPLELMDTRFALEPHICRLAVLHGRQADFARMEELCSLMEQCEDDPVAFSEADTEFHQSLVHSTRNGLLCWIIDQIGSVRGADDWTRMRHLTLCKHYSFDNSNIIHSMIRTKFIRCCT